MIRLALGDDLAGVPFTRFLFELEHHTPPVAVDLREVDHMEAVRLVRDGGVDAALTLEGRAVINMRLKRAWEEKLMLVVPIGHQLAEHDHVDLKEIALERLALPRQEICPGYLAQVEALFSRHHMQITNRVSVRHWNTAVSFAATGKALALCLASFVNGATTVAVIPIAVEDA